jgi:hypothetical protein
MEDIPWERGFRFYRIAPNGLKFSDELARRPEEWVTADVTPFRVLANMFWNRRLVLPIDYQPKIMMLTATLETAGARPVDTNHPEDIAVEYWFDISTETCKAYYMLAITRRSNEVKNTVYCAKATPDVVKNARALDEALYVILKQCELLDQ